MIDAERRRALQKSYGRRKSVAVMTDSKVEITLWSAHCSTGHYHQNLICSFLISWRSVVLPRARIQFNDLRFGRPASGRVKPHLLIQCNWRNRDRKCCLIGNFISQIVISLQNVCACLSSSTERGRRLSSFTRRPRQQRACGDHFSLSLCGLLSQYHMLNTNLTGLQSSDFVQQTISPDCTKQGMVDIAITYFMLSTILRT